MTFARRFPLALFVASLALGCGGQTVATSEPDGGAPDETPDAARISVPVDTGAPDHESAEASTRPDASASVDTGAPDHESVEASTRPDAQTSCVLPTPVLHRAVATACPAAADAGSVCTQDSDCADAGHEAVCACDEWGLDAGCAASSCFNSCLPANCHVDSDCGPGGYCSPSLVVSGGQVGSDFVGAFYCHTCSDTCANDSDCSGYSFCAYDPDEGSWTCVPGVNTG
jgi:hypothetical protein